MFLRPYTRSSPDIQTRELGDVELGDVAVVVVVAE